MIHVHFSTSLLALAFGGLASLPALSQTADPAIAGTVDVVGYTSIDAPTGAYGQPGWVQRRPFPTTRVHIQRNPGEVSVEQWMRVRTNDGDTKFRFQEEMEFGLPGRFQIDLYYDWTIEDSKADHLDFAGEVRWAPADWGQMFLNPALYLEYKVTDPSRGGDVIEPKLLIGDDFGNGWHWGMNFVYERELQGEKAEEIAITNAISKTINESLSIGIEMAWKHETVDGERNNPEHKFIIGPQLQWRPSKNMHIDLVAMAGCTKDSPDFEGWLIIGYDFGGSSEKHGNAPISGRR
jgi:Putative MetA-pathway of phenol degradation